MAKASAGAVLLVSTTTRRRSWEDDDDVACEWERMGEGRSTGAARGGEW